MRSHAHVMAAYSVKAAAADSRGGQVSAEAWPVVGENKQAQRLVCDLQQSWSCAVLLQQHLHACLQTL
jgi:hypothetical protein